MSAIKGYYLKLSDTTDINKAVKGNGVFKKVKAQAECLAKYFDCTLELVQIDNEQTRFAKIKRRLPFTAIGHKWKYDPKYKTADFIYIRKESIDYSLYRFLRKIKKENPKCLILMEIPTYPYDQEIKQAAHSKIFYIKDVLNRNKLHKCVDCIVLCHKAETVFRLPTLYMPNGFDFANNPMRKIDHNCDTISIIGVAFLAFWHGYDRLIQGMGEYYQSGGTRDIVFHCVGNGVALPRLKQLAAEYHIEDKVIFHGSKQGQELNDVYDMCNLAVDSLGNFRREVYLSSSLKSREYYAKGLPILNSGAIDFIEPDFPYFMSIAEDDAPVNIPAVIDYFDALYGNESADVIADKVRSYAEERCSWEKTMSEVVTYIQENSNK